MKKRLISLLVALCMAVTLLPVSAITAWAEESSSNSTTLRIKNGYPVGSGKNHDENCSGDGWSYDGSTQTLDLHPDSPTDYDFSKLISGTGTVLACALKIGEKATITDGRFINNITNSGTITGGVFQPLSSKSLTFENSGIITGGEFLSTWGSLNFTNSISGTIEGGIFSVSSLSNSGAINGGVFPTRPNGNKVAAGYTLNVESPDSTTEAGIEYFKASRYIIPHSSYTTSITVLYHNRLGLQPFPIDVTIDNTQQKLLTEWAGKVESSSDPDVLYVTFTAPPADAGTVTLSKLTRLVIDIDGYPVGTKGGTQDYSGNGWRFEKSNKTLTLESGSYDFSGEENALRPLNPNVHLVVESGAALTGGAFKNEPTVEGAGTDTFKKVILNGTGSITAVNGLASDWGKTLYAVQTGYNTITASKPILDINRILLENGDPLYPDSSNKNTVRINIEFLNSVSALDPEADIILNQASHGLPLIMDSDGTPVIVDAPFEVDGNYYNYYGDGWKVNKVYDGMNHGTLYLTGGKTYNFRFTDPVNKTGQLDAVKCGIVNEGSIIEDGIFNTLVANGWPNGDPTKTHKIEGGTFAAGLYYNNGEITGGAFNGKDSIFTHETVLSGNYRSVTVNGGAIVKVNDTLPLVYNETTYDLVQGSAWDLYSYAGTVLTVESNVDITNINGQEIGKAFNSSYPNGETNKKVVCFEMPDSDVELNSTKIVDPDPKPEPEAPTYTLTVKGGTFTYNGGEAMTSASVPVDAEVKVTLNQSAVPEGMVFDLWAMDEASLLGNLAVAYNQESFTIPAGTVAKGSTVTVEAQYRDATIESEPSILGTAAIIGVAGAGTAVIVWQGYRIGMELYEKYFQPTPEEDAVVEPTLESQMTDPIS
mgnify:CR=1 FL=1